MKRLFYLLACCLCIGMLMPCALAQEGPFSLSLFKEGETPQYIKTLCAVGDEIYILSHTDALYRLDIAQQRAEPVPLEMAAHDAVKLSPAFEKLIHTYSDGPYASIIPDMLRHAQSPGMLMSDGDRLLGINIETGIVYLYTPDGKGGFVCAPLVSLEWDGLVSAPDNTQGTGCEGYVLHGDTLHLALSHNSEEEDGNWNRIIAFDLKTGKPQSTVPGAAYLTGYGPDAMLYIDTNYAVHIIDYERGEILKAPFDMLSAVLNVAYDVQSGQAFCLRMEDNRLYTTTDFKVFRVHAHLPQTLYDRVWQMALVSGGHVVLKPAQKLLVYPLSDYQKQEPLRILGESQLLDSFGEKYLSLPVELTQTYEDVTGAFIQHMTQRDSWYDIYELTVNEAFLQARQKGFYYDLSPLPGILPQAESLYAPLKAILMDGARLMGLPTVLRQSGVGHSRWAAAQLGLSGDDMPQTYGEFIDFLLAWQENDLGIGPYGGTDEMMRLELLAMICSSYQSHYLSDPDAARAITDEVAALLKKISLINGLTARAPSRAETEQRIGWSNQPDILFTLNASLLPGKAVIDGVMSLDFAFLPLRLKRDAPPLIPVQAIKAYVINPYSLRIADAGIYLAHYLADKPPSQMAVFYSGGWLEESTYYIGRTRRMQSDLEELARRFDLAEPQMQKDIQARIDDTKAELAAWEQYRYAVTPDMAQSYAQSVMAMDFIGLTAPQPHTQNLFSRLSAGLIDPETYLREVQDMCDKVMRERER